MAPPDEEEKPEVEEEGPEEAAPEQIRPQPRAVVPAGRARFYNALGDEIPEGSAYAAGHGPMQRLYNQQAQLWAQLPAGMKQELMFNQLKLSQAESIHLQRLENARGAINANPNLSKEDKADLITQLQLPYNLLSMRAAKAKAIQQEMEVQRLQSNAKMVNDLNEQQRNANTQNIGKQVHLDSAHGEAPAMWVRDQHGVPMVVRNHAEEQRVKILADLEKNKQTVADKAKTEEHKADAEWRAAHGKAVTAVEKAWTDRHKAAMKPSPKSGEGQSEGGSLAGTPEAIPDMPAEDRKKAIAERLTEIGHPGSWEEHLKSRGRPVPPPATPPPVKPVVEPFEKPTAATPEKVVGRLRLQAVYAHNRSEHEAGEAISRIADVMEKYPGGKGVPEDVKAQLKKDHALAKAKVGFGD